MRVRGFVLGFFVVLLVVLTGLSSAPQAAAQPPSPSPENIPNGQTQSLDLIGQVGGVSTAVTLAGHYAYVGVGPRLHILDISDPARPFLVGQSPVWHSLVSDIAVVGNYAYVAAGYGGLHILDISDLATPVEVASYDDEGVAESVVVQDSYVYIALAFEYHEGFPISAGGLLILDVSDPATPTQAAFYKGSQSELGFDARDLALNDDDLFILDGDACDYECEPSTLRAVDVSDPSRPVELGTFNTNRLMRTFTIAENLAYIVGSGGFQIVDISQPAQVTHLGSGGPSGDDFVLLDNYAYIVNEDNGLLTTVDVSDPAAPVRLRQSDVPPVDTAIATDGDHLYITGREEGLHIFSRPAPDDLLEVGAYQRLGRADNFVANTTHAYLLDRFDDTLTIVDANATPESREVATLATGAWASDAELVDEVLYLGFGSLRVFDVREPNAPVQVGEYRAYGPAREIVVRGNRTFLFDKKPNPYTRSTITILDTSDPAHPLKLGSFTPDSLGFEYQFTDDLFFIAEGDISPRVHIVDMGDPAAPVGVGWYSTTGQAKSIIPVGDILYLSDRRGFHIVDISHVAPSGTRALAIYETTARLQAVSGHYAYLLTYADFDDESEQFAGAALHLLDISDKSAPREVSRYEIEGIATQVKVAGNYAYIVKANEANAQYGDQWSGAGVEIVDISQPATPKRAGLFDDLFEVEAFAIEGSKIYLSGGSYGLFVLDFAPPEPSAVTLGPLQAHSRDIAAPVAMIVVWVLGVVALHRWHTLWQQVR